MTQFKPCFDGALRDPGCGRDLTLAHALIIGEFDGLPLSLRQVR
jgi:hypothetical protein